MSGVLKSPSHKYLPRGEGGAGGGLLSFFSKRLCKMKYGFERSIFKCQSWPAVAKQPINVWFCDILLLLNHMNKVTSN